MFTMRKTALFALALVGVVGLGGAGAALANTATDESAEIASVMAAKTSPADAVRAAEASAGGHAVAMGLERKGNRAAYYEVLVNAPGGLEEVRLDPASGAVQGATKVGTSALEDLKPNQLGQATAAQVTLAEAIRTAEQATGGRALEAGYTIRDGRAVGVVEVATKTGLRRVSVNGSDASKVTLANSELGESGPDND